MPHGVQIGDYEPQVPVQEGLRRVIPEVRPGNLGNEVESLGATSLQAQRVVQTKDAAVYVGKNIADARVAAEKLFLDTQPKPQAEIDKDGGFTDYTATVIGMSMDAMAQILAR